MREDAKGRWRVGQKIHFCSGYHEGAIFHEATITGIQVVQIHYLHDAQRIPDIVIDGRKLGIVEIIGLAANDGFDTLDGFLEWFDQSGTYRLLHWTEFTYDGSAKQLQQIHDRHAGKNTLPANHTPGGIRWSVDDGAIVAEGELLLPTLPEGVAKGIYTAPAESSVDEDPDPYTISDRRAEL